MSYRYRDSSRYDGAPGYLLRRSKPGGLIRHPPKAACPQQYIRAKSHCAAGDRQTHAVSVENEPAQFASCKYFRVPSHTRSPKQKFPAVPSVSFAEHTAGPIRIVRGQLGRVLEYGSAMRCRRSDSSSGRSLPLAIRKLGRFSFLDKKLPAFIEALAVKSKTRSCALSPFRSIARCDRSRRSSGPGP